MCAPTQDGKSQVIVRLAAITAAPPPTAEQTEALKTDVGKQLRVDVLEQYVGGLRARYGYTVNEKLLKQALGPQNDQSQDNPDSSDD